MTVSYTRLWKLLIDKKIKKKQLMELANVNHGAMAKMLHDVPINLSILMRICEVLQCDLGDIVELVPEEKPPANASP